MSQQALSVSGQTTATAAGSPSHRIVSSSKLFGTCRQLIITHAGEEYRLNITSKDKLILTK